MINFVIYEDEKRFRDQYISVILRVMGNERQNYKILEFDHYADDVKKILNTNGQNIYFLDVEVPGKSGLDLARDIRNRNDWLSPIIVITTHDNLQKSAFSRRLLAIDFISKFDCFNDNLGKALLDSYIMVTTFKSLKTQKDGEFKQIYYNDILYIKKDNDDIDTKVYLQDGNYIEIKEPIGKLEEILSEDPRFFRTHRSCIVNISKIKNVDLVCGVINFENSSINMLARDRKKDFKDILWDDQLHSQITDVNKKKVQM